MKENRTLLFHFLFYSLHNILDIYKFLILLSFFLIMSRIIMKEYKKRKYRNSYIEAKLISYSLSWHYINKNKKITMCQDNERKMKRTYRRQPLTCPSHADILSRDLCGVCEWTGNSCRTISRTR